MVTIDVYVPALDKVYYFKLDETVDTEDLMDEMVEMIGQKEQSNIVGDIKDIMLVKKGSNYIIPFDKSLNEVGVKTGDMLLLV